MDPAIEDLISGINFELDPVFVIRTVRNGIGYFLKDMEFFISREDFVRTRKWTGATEMALKFYDYDEIVNFIKHQMQGTHVTIKEII